MIEFIPEMEIKIEDAIYNYIKFKLSTNILSDSSVYNRSYELNRFTEFLEDNNKEYVTEIDKNIIVKYLGALDVNSNSKRTIMSILASFLDYLVEENLILDNYLGSMKKPKVYPIEGDYLTKEEIDTIFKVVNKTTSKKLADRNLLLLSLFTVLCMRVSEAINLKMQHVNLKEKKVWITRKGGKIAKLPLNDDLCEKFNNWYKLRINNKGDVLPWVFLTTHGKQMTVRQARHVVAHALKKSGIEKRKKGPHLLRHSGATLYLQQGTDIKTIQYLLGHSNLTTTSKYVHSDSATLQKSVNDCPIFG